MPIRREFIDWSKPALREAALFLFRRYRRGPLFDLRNVVVAVPGGRAGRRLLEILVDVADEKSVELVPPEILTTGALPEILYQAKKPFADPLTQNLAWVAALQQTDPQALTQLIPNAPKSRDVLPWLPLGELLSALHRELAADGLDCADVVRLGRTLATFKDSTRWTLLADVQQRYLVRLDALQLWDRQTARLFAIKHRECQSDRDIVLVGTVDMNRTQREMLDQVAERVTALIFAPPSLKDRFDEHGCVIAAAWCEADIPVDPSLVTVADGPGDQADAVVRALAAFGGRYPAEDIVVGVPDERLVTYVEQRLEECELPARYGVGHPVSQSEPFRLLQAIAAWLDSSRYEAFANVYRHPALERWLLGAKVSGDGLTALDEVYSDRLPWEVRSSELRAVIEETLRQEANCTDDPRRISLEQKRKRYEFVESLIVKLDELTAPLRSGKKRLSAWGDAIGGLLSTVYGTAPMDTSDPGLRRIVAACGAIHDVLVEQRHVPDDLAPMVTGGEALRLVLQAAGSGTIPPPAKDAAIELLGWLELPLDDAPALVLTGLNEGIVPSTRNGDLFLPNEMRKHLGLEDNDRRYARDAYALNALSVSREALRIIAGRRTSDNDPLVPSRLLFCCSPEETARRTREWLGERKALSGRLVLPAGLRHGKGTRFSPPRPQRLGRPIDSMRVTEFKDYLACPYRYYLKHQLNLARQSDASQELDGGQFGSLLHEVLSKFGEECLRDPVFGAATSAGEIGEFLNQRLEDLSGAFYGAEPLPAVRVQIELIRRRLFRFAEWQAAWARQGWRVQYVEHDIPRDEAALPLATGPMRLRGRIDRIDARGEETIVFDYKTGDSGRSPEETHRDKASESWTDLQLPLYRHACRWIKVGKSVQVGYIVLPKSEEKVGEKIAAWTEDMFADATREAMRIAELVRGEQFWPPSESAAGLNEDLAAICGDYRFVSPPPDEDPAAE
ncbi:MAG: PD-(D/E)XK nuclease family protein [Planctomycetaceae bacterium]|nr:PD-(D/E)XK nuclease family protein [Planctomycetaceae bacterium]